MKYFTTNARLITSFYFYETIICCIMYVAITCIMTCSISKGFVTYHGSLECEINYNYNYNMIIPRQSIVHCQPQEFCVGAIGD